MADNVTANSIPVATRNVTYSGDAGQNIQIMGLALLTGSDDSKTATDVSTTSPLPLTFNDPSATTGNITAVDSATTSTTNAAGQSIITGTPTANSSITASFTGQSTVTVQLSGTANFVVAFEISTDGGTTYIGTQLDELALGINVYALTASDNKAYILRGNVAGMTNFRVRATTFNSGTLAVRIQPALTLDQAPHVMGITLHDSVLSSGIYPISIGGYAKATAPTDVADGDLANIWVMRNGAQATVVTAAGALIGGDATNGLDVDITRVKPDGTNTMPSMDVASRASFNKITDGTLTVGAVDETGSSAVDAIAIGGGTPHDSANSGNPLYLGAEAIAHGTNPTAVAAADRTKLYANRAGIPFVIGGHPNIQTIRLQFTAAQTNVAVITVSTGSKIVVTGFQFTLDNASTVFPSVLLGFATATTPTTSQVIGAHGGVPAGGGFGRGDGSGIIGIGADDQDLRITTVGAATGNGCELVVSYYTIES